MPPNRPNAADPPEELAAERAFFAHMVVHDLRTPLTSIISGLQTMQMLGDMNSDCKMAVESHGGEIGVESGMGKGSTFWSTIPIALAPLAG